MKVMGDSGQCRVLDLGGVSGCTHECGRPFPTGDLGFDGGEAGAGAQRTRVWTLPSLTLAGFSAPCSFSPAYVRCQETPGRRGPRAGRARAAGVSIRRVWARAENLRFQRVPKSAAPCPRPGPLRLPGRAAPRAVPLVQVRRAPPPPQVAPPAPRHWAAAGGPSRIGPGGGPASPSLAAGATARPGTARPADWPPAPPRSAMFGHRPPRPRPRRTVQPRAPPAAAPRAVGVPRSSAELAGPGRSRRS